MEWGLEGVVWLLGSSDCLVNLLACSSTRTKLQIVAPAETDRYDKDKSTSLSTLVIIFVEDIGHMFPANIECGRHAFSLRMTQILKLTFFPVCVESHHVVSSRTSLASMLMSAGVHHSQFHMPGKLLVQDVFSYCAAYGDVVLVI